MHLVRSSEENPKQRIVGPDLPGARSSFCGFGLIERGEVVVELCLGFGRVGAGSC